MIQSDVDFRNELTPEEVFINKKGNHYKVWGYLNIGYQFSASTKFTVVCFWGRIGSKLQAIVKDFDSVYEAYTFVRSKIYEKMNKGYEAYSLNKYFNENKATLLEELFDTISIPKSEKLNRFKDVFDKIDVNKLIDSI